jgi:cytochrome c oxidase assembly protein subunit 15
MMEQGSSKSIAYWLLTVAGVVFCMIAIGGLTRLTQSGLSMVEWKPIMGTLPPLSDGDWQEMFEKYQQSPEYQKVNLGMSMDDFRSIFWFEYGHRVLGRFIGLIFAIPFGYFLIKRKMTPRLIARLLLLFILGGAQGVIGWWMVKSGLVDRPDVSHYRLTTHLGMAFLLYIALLWTGLEELRPSLTSVQNKFALASSVILGMAYLTVLSGGLVAGLDAGQQFNTFPLMAGQIIPEGLFVQSPWYQNFTENILTVQFNHRILAISTAFVVLGFWYVLGSEQLSSSARRARHAMLIAVGLQVTLGILTLLSFVWIPLASAHQMGAIVLLSTLVWISHELWRPLA